MRYLLVTEVLDLHRRIIIQSGGSPGVRDINALDSAVAQPSMTFAEHELNGKILQPGFSLTSFP